MSVDKVSSNVYRKGCLHKTIKVVFKCAIVTNIPALLFVSVDVHPRWSGGTHRLSGGVRFRSC